MKCLVVIADPGRDRPLIDVAAALAGTDDVVLASVIEVPEGQTLASAQPQARAMRRELIALAAPLVIRPIVTVARLGWAAATEAVRDERPDLLLIGWRRPGWDYLGTTMEDILRDPPCDLAIVRGPAGRARRILVPVRGGRYAELAAKLGVALARARKGTVTLLHVVPSDTATRRRGATLYQLVGEPAFDDRVDELLTRVGDAETVIAAEVDRHLRDLRSSKTLPGFDAIRLPGEERRRRRADRQQNGVPMAQELIVQLDRLATEQGVVPVRGR